MYDFILQYMLYLQWIWWEWEKKKNEIYTGEKQEKIPFGCPPIPPSMKLAADCFPGRKNRKQAGPTLGWTGILIFEREVIVGTSI